MQKRQYILGAQNFKFLMLNMRFGMTLEHSKHAPLWQGGLTHKSIVYTSTCCIRGMH